MGPDRWQQVEEILGAALGLPLLEREDFAERACGGDGELLAEVLSLLRADAMAGPFLDQPILPPVLEGPAAAEGTPWAGRSLGSYRLLRKLGEGGMSTVYLAEREDEQYRRQVAIKVLRSALGGADSRRRLRAERQILATLDHPGIARLYDGGTTEEGLPYLVMEYIEGEPIDEFCDRRRLSVPQRLELFRTVCGAVHYAHQHLVVHRDLKPGNLLVTGEGVAKLVDFGIAKLLKPEGLPAGPAATVAWLRLLTPDYASPEQVQGKPISTASDIYSLGVLLYKLLTGRLPHSFAGRSPQEIERALAEEEPARPSAAVFQLAPRPAAEEPVGLLAVSRARRTSPGQLRRQLKGDLDNIVLKALRLEPQRRYSSAERLAEDLRRHLVGLPVQAHPDSFAYRSRKFLRRNGLAVGLASAIAVLLFGAALLFALQSARLAEERDRARRERDKAQQVAVFLEELFAASNPGAARGEAATGRELLERGVAKVEGFVDHPEVQAALFTTLGRIYRELGAYEPSQPLLERALALRQEGGARPDLELAESLRELGQLRYRQGLYGEAESLLRESLELQEEGGGGAGPAFASTLGDLAAVLQAGGRYAEAEGLYRDALARLARGPARPGAERAELENNLSTLLVARGSYEEAEQLLDQALTLWRRTLGQNHPTTLMAVNNLAALLYAKGDYSAAIARYQEALKQQRKLLGDAHPDVALSLNNLGVLLYHQGRFAEAKERASQALELRRQLLGDAHPDVAQSLSNLGAMLRDEGSYAEAEPLLREALRLWRRLYQDEHPSVARGLNQLALLAAARGDAGRAEPLFRQALEMRRRLLGDDHPEVAGSLIGLGKLLTASGELGEAEGLLQRALQIRRRKLPPTHPQIAEAEQALGGLFVRSQRFAEAEPLLLDSHRILGGERVGRRQGSYGMTWGRAGANPTLGTVTAGCVWPCNPYGGDTSCRVALPVLCLRDSGRPNPGIPTNPYHGWIGGETAVTEKVRGMELTSLAAADQLCAERFGPGWRMAEFHHSEGGWNWSAYGELPAGQHFWVHINDQPGNCWDS